jgi:NADPH:quinone reductase-like Zn-dependent oxidoreductase
VFDAIANLDFAEAKHILSDDGVYMSSIPSPTNMLVAPVLNRFRGKQHRTLWVSPDGDALREVARMVEAGQLRPLIEKVYALDDIRAAHAHSKTGRVVGKLALRIEG